MAERRMFAKSIVLSDAFLDMPLSARCLYFTLGMLADDDGFVGNPKSIMRQCGASQDDMSVLLQKRYVLGFESGVIVIKHWRINNYLREDRHKDTTYVEEIETLTIDSKGAYTEIYKSGIPSANQMPTKCQPRLDKNSIDKVSIGENNITGTHAYEDFINDYPSLQEIKDFIVLKDIKVDAERFYNYYSALGWRLGNTPITNWQSLALEWARKDMTKERVASFKSKTEPIQTHEYTEDDLSNIFKTSDITDEEI